MEPAFLLTHHPRSHVYHEIITRHSSSFEIPLLGFYHYSRTLSVYLGASPWSNIRDDPEIFFYADRVICISKTNTQLIPNFQLPAMAVSIMDFVQRYTSIQQQRDTSDELIKVPWQSPISTAIRAPSPLPILLRMQTNNVIHPGSSHLLRTKGDCLAY